jgi:general secretion pathway protein C
MSKLYYTVFNLLALSVISYTGVDLFYKIASAQLGHVDTQKMVMQQISEVKQLKRSPLSSYRTITDRDLFGTPKNAPEDVKKEVIETLQPTSLKIALLGTVIGNDQNDWAVIEETGKRKQGLYRVGDSIQNAVLKKILRGKVVLRVGDRDEVLIIKERSSSERKEPRMAARRAARPTRGRERTITVRRSDIDESLEDINNLLSTALIRPHFTDGVADGLVISRIKSGSIFRKLGLRSGDIVKGINGNPIETPDDILSIYSDMKAGSPISIQIKRRGQERTINYRFR